MIIINKYKLLIYKQLNIMEITEKNTKAEILKAYETLLKGIQTAKTDVSKQLQERMITAKPEKEDN